MKAIRLERRGAETQRRGEEKRRGEERRGEEREREKRRPNRSTGVSPVLMSPAWARRPCYGDAFLSLSLSSLRLCASASLRSNPGHLHLRSSAFICGSNPARFQLSGSLSISSQSIGLPVA